jgi:hypothetical protein
VYDNAGGNKVRIGYVVFNLCEVLREPANSWIEYHLTSQSNASYLAQHKTTVLVHTTLLNSGSSRESDEELLVRLNARFNAAMVQQQAAATTVEQHQAQHPPLSPSSSTHDGKDSKTSSHRFRVSFPQMTKSNSSNNSIRTALVVGLFALCTPSRPAFHFVGKTRKLARQSDAFVLPVQHVAWNAEQTVELMFVVYRIRGKNKAIVGSTTLDWSALRRGQGRTLAKLGGTIDDELSHITVQFEDDSKPYPLATPEALRAFASKGEHVTMHSSGGKTSEVLFYVAHAQLKWKSLGALDDEQSRVVAISSVRQLFLGKLTPVLASDSTNNNNNNVECCLGVKLVNVHNPAQTFHLELECVNVKQRDTIAQCLLSAASAAKIPVLLTSKTKPFTSVFD